MLKEKVEDALNDQIRREFASAYLYLSMVAYFDDANLPGFAHWMGRQSEEEQSAENLVAALRQAGDDSAALFILKRESGQR